MYHENIAKVLASVEDESKYFDMGSSRHCIYGHASRIFGNHRMGETPRDYLARMLGVSRLQACDVYHSTLWSRADAAEYLRSLLAA